MPRRTQSELDALRAVLFALCEEHKPLTLRSLFYRAVAVGAVAKEETQYKRIGQLTRNMRRDRQLPYSWLVDAGRFARRSSVFDGPAHILRAARDTYRRDLWRNQPVHVEVWIEKDAVVGVVEEVTDALQVPLYSCRGYPSLSMVWQAVQDWPDKPVAVRYFGDCDPSGSDIPRAAQEIIEEVHGRPVDFRVCAITAGQIAQYDLPTRPTKRTDSRAKNYLGPSVELDAFEPSTLRGLVEQAITVEQDATLWGKTLNQQDNDRAALNDAVDAMLEDAEL